MPSHRLHLHDKPPLVVRQVEYQQIHFAAHISPHTVLLPLKNDLFQIKVLLSQNVIMARLVKSLMLHLYAFLQPQITLAFDNNQLKPITLVDILGRFLQFLIINLMLHLHYQAPLGHWHDLFLTVLLLGIKIVNAPAHGQLPSCTHTA